MAKRMANGETGDPELTHETHHIYQPLPTSVKTVGEGARRAVALEKNVREKLTPTLKKFTLEEKVAVVTG